VYQVENSISLIAPGEFELDDPQDDIPLLFTGPEDNGHAVALSITITEASGSALTSETHCFPTSGPESVYNTEKQL